MIELDKTTFCDINPTDRIFLQDGLNIKVRIVRKDTFHNGIASNPRAITLLMTGSICDSDGKALRRADGNYLISSHAYTLTLEDMVSIDLDAAIDANIEKCCTETIEQKLRLEKLDAISSKWNNPAAFFRSPS